jgi:hypothetical protein
MSGKATVLLAILVCLLLPLRSSSQTKPSVAPVAPMVYRGDGWSIAAPGDWGSTAEAPPVVLNLVGDGCEGVPTLDGTLSAVKVGLQIQQISDPTVSLKDAVDSDVKGMKESHDFEVLVGPGVRDIALRDGTKATLVKAELVRRSDARLSIFQKLYCVDAAGRHLVVTGFITCSRSGAGFVKALRLPEFLEAHVTSLVLVPDLERLKATYQKHDWKAVEAVALAREANRMLGNAQYPQAIDLYREALKLCPYMPAANNGLAWALLQRKEAPPRDLQEALGAAQRAVELTEQLDFATLDTLALAQFRSGQKDQAIKTIQQALKLRPDEAELQARLKSFQEAK